MSGPGSVTLWLDRVKAGDRGEAFTRLWERYFSRLVHQVRHSLRSRTRVKDGEDVALSAFDGFVRAVAAQRFPKLNDRDDLWQVLLLIAARKASNAVRDEGRVILLSAVMTNPDRDALGIFSDDPDPAEAAALGEEFERLLDLLRNQQLRSVAVWSLEGFTNAEIAEKLDCSKATVERRLNRIRAIWSKQGAGPDQLDR